MVEEKIIAVIPARGGSKRIPQKNIIDFMGKPMIAWTIEAAIESKLFSKIIVSTDDEKIKNISLQWGAEVPFLRENFADDYTPVSEATLDAVIKAEKIYGETYTTVFQLMPNCPLRNEKTIKIAYDHFLDKNISFQISCFKFGWMNPWWAAKIDSFGVPTPIFREALKKRSQDMEDLYCPTGAIWISKVEELKKSKTFYGQNHIYHPISWEEAVDIDEIEDLNIAKAVYRMIEREEDFDGNRVR